MPNTPSTTAQPFRQVTSGVLGRLNHAWAQLTLRGHEAVVARWCAAYPCLAPARSLSDVVGIVRRRIGRNDAETAALISLAQSGDDLAGQALLQILVAPACRLASRTRAYAPDLETARGQAISALWMAVSEYRLERRRGNHIAGLTLDALRTITRRGAFRDEIPAGLMSGSDGPRSTTAVEGGRGSLTTWALPETARERFWARTSGAPRPDGDGELARLLGWAERARVLNPTQTMILWRMHGPERATSAAIAAGMGITAGAVRQRGRTAISALSVAVRRPEPVASGESLRAMGA